MKKKLFGIIMVAMVAVAAAWNVCENKNEVSLTDLALSNVEALASEEGGWADCSYYGCIIAWNYTCTVYSSIWGSQIRVCPEMRG